MLKKLTFIAITLLLVSCSGASLVVDGKYPDALTRKINASAGLLFDTDFQNYTYISEGSPAISMALGAAQVEFFGQVLGDIFTQTTGVNSAHNQSGVDLIIAPHVEEVQLLTPLESNLKIFEVWIKYNIQVFDSDGDILADWLMTSYGKTQDRFMASSEDALNEAAIVALRDAGTRLVIELPRVPEVRAWLAQQTLASPDKSNSR